MSILKPNVGYEMFEEVNVGRREFIVHEDHTSETPFNKKLLIGFGGILLAVVLLFAIGYFFSDSYDNSVGELPYLPAFYSTLGQERSVVEKTLRSAGAQVTYDPAIKGYRLKDPVLFAGHRFDVMLSYNLNNKLESVTYVLPSNENAEMMASHAHQLIGNTQDAWGFSRGSIFSRHYVECDSSDLEKAFAGTKAWQQEITWIVDKDISELGFEEGDCISVRFCADNPGNGGTANIRFVFGLDTAESEDFIYEPGAFTGIYE